MKYVLFLAVLFTVSAAQATDRKPKPPPEPQPQPIMISQKQINIQKVNVEGDTINVSAPNVDSTINNEITVEPVINNEHTINVLPAESYVDVTGPTINQGDIYVGGNTSFVDATSGAVTIEGVSKATMTVSFGATRVGDQGNLDSRTDWSAALNIPITFGMGDALEKAKAIQQYRHYVMKSNEARAVATHNINIESSARTQELDELQMILMCVEMHKMGTFVAPGLATFCKDVSFKNDEHGMPLEQNPTHTRVSDHIKE